MKHEKGKEIKGIGKIGIIMTDKKSEDVSYHLPKF